VLIPRVIPVLLLKAGKVVKTTKFKNPVYVGDPINIVRIFCEKEVDELVFLDIEATPQGREPDYAGLGRLVDECFMPIGYGGGVRDVEQMRRIFGLGVEKVVLNTAAVEDPGLVERAAAVFGSQSVVVSLDVRTGWFGRQEVVTRCGSKGTGKGPVEWARIMREAGAGELVLNSIDRDGTMQGLDLSLIRTVAEAVDIPLVACGGASSVEDVARAINEGKASAAAAGSLFIFKGPHRAVLPNYPARARLEALFAPQAKVS